MKCMRSTKYNVNVNTNNFKHKYTIILYYTVVKYILSLNQWWYYLVSIDVTTVKISLLTPW